MTYLYKQDLNLNTEFLEQSIAEIDIKQINKVPKDGTWSVLQVLEHIYYVEKGTFFLMQGPVKENYRKPFEKIEEIKTYLLDFNKKAEAPGTTQPKGKFDDPSKALEKIRANRSAIIEHMTNENKYDLVDSFEHFYFGKMTRIEWLYMMIYHVDRHIHQADIMLQKMSLESA